MSTHRQIFKASAIIGGASVINVVVGLVKVKMLAVLLGPAGVGLFGLYQNIMNVASTLAGCGLANSGVRQLAASQEDAVTLALVRKALFYANLLLGFTGMAALWLLREPVAHWVFGNAEHVAEVGYLSLGVLLSLLAGSQTALLQGLRRISDLARVQVFSALVGAVIGIAAVVFWGRAGMLAFILASPAASVLVAAGYARSLPRPKAEHDWPKLRRQWQAMFFLGIPLMVAGLLNLIVLLVARSMVTQNLGLEATGYFQAAWAISMTYLGFVLNAMGMDYYPKLTGVIQNHEKANQMVNEQTEMMLLLAGPVLLGMMTFAPWVIEALYATTFAPATELLRWQVLGDIVKVMAFPIAFVVLADGRGVLYIGTQMVWNVVYVLFLWFGLPELGLVALGIGFFLAYLVQVGILGIVAGGLTGFRGKERNLWFFSALLLAATLIFAATYISLQVSYGLGTLMILVIGYYSARRLNKLMNLSDWLKMRLRS